MGVKQELCASAHMARVSLDNACHELTLLFSFLVRAGNVCDVLPGVHG
jgi:hypothetical protein